MIIERKAFMIYVDLDRVPGAFHTVEDARARMSRILEEEIPQYRPEMEYLHTHMMADPGGIHYNRAAYCVKVDLDPTPGMFHSQESAQSFLRVLLNDRIHHYRPMVSLAPAHRQPENAGKFDL